MTLQLQIASDLHLEYETGEKFADIINPVAPILILAGDIGNLYQIDKLRKLIAWCCEKFVAVIYVPGNHEYYTCFDTPVLPFYKLNFRLSDLDNEFMNLYILRRNCLEINGIYIAGCTLWSNLKRPFLPNFIVRIKGFNKYQYNEEHRKDLKFIKQIITKSQVDNKKLIIITHHLPFFMTSSTKINDPYNSLYFTNLEYLLKKEKVDTWVCGHIHKNFDFISSHGTRVVGNQKGKPRDKITDYSPKLVIHV